MSEPTGHNFSLEGHYLFEFFVLGGVLTTPFYIIFGLSKCEAVLGIDIIRETQICIRGDDVFFNNLSVFKNIQCSVILRDAVLATDWFLYI